MVEDQLKKLREGIDRIDEGLLDLLQLRMALAMELGQVKASAGLPLIDPGREQAILERLLAENRGPLPGESLRAIYREILASSRRIQHKTEVAFLGPELTFSHLASLSLFGHAARYVPCPSFEDVFSLLVKRQVQMAVVPIENSLQGGIGLIMDLLHEFDVTVSAEHYLEISHHLCGKLPSIHEAKRLYAHPQAAQQCRRWLNANMKEVQILESASTALAAKLAKDDPEAAALCNLFAARHHGLNVLVEHVEDRPGNTTRFFVLSETPSAPTGADKTSLLFSVPDQPGSLHAALQAFSGSGVNMTRIESRPNRRNPWQYLFFADIEGHRDDLVVAGALDDLRRRVTLLKVLGSYPKGDPAKPVHMDPEQLNAHDRGEAEASASPTD